MRIRIYLACYSWTVISVTNDLSHPIEKPIFSRAKHFTRPHFSPQTVLYPLLLLLLSYTWRCRSKHLHARRERVPRNDHCSTSHPRRRIKRTSYWNFPQNIIFQFRRSLSLSLSCTHPSTSHRLLPPLET